VAEHRCDARVVVATDRFAADLSELVEHLGFRVDAIFPADAPRMACVSGHGIHLRLESALESSPITIHLVSNEPGGAVTLPGGTRFLCRPRDIPYRLPPNRPSLVITHDDGTSHVGRAGMRYRDLLPDRWGGRFIASLISIPNGGPVPDYVHFHKVRFQLIVVKRGWVRVAYEGQGKPFVLHAGDCVIQPPEIRHHVLEASAGLEVVEIGTPAEHETIADWEFALPGGPIDPDREWDGQRFVRHHAADATYEPWRIDGWECRETGVSDATRHLAGVRVARPAGPTSDASTLLGTEFAMLVVLAGSVSFVADGRPAVLLTDGSSVAIPSGMQYRLIDPSPDCELLDVTMPA
jgi:quercetin dioxygenase-like cupin family protein